MIYASLWRLIFLFIICNNNCAMEQSIDFPAKEESSDNFEKLFCNLFEMSLIEKNPEDLIKAWDFYFKKNPTRNELSPTIRKILLSLPIAPGLNVDDKTYLPQGQPNWHKYFDNKLALMNEKKIYIKDFVHEESRVKPLIHFPLAINPSNFDGIAYKEDSKIYISDSSTQKEKSTPCFPGKIYHAAFVGEKLFVADERGAVLFDLNNNSKKVLSNKNEKDGILWVSKLGDALKYVDSELKSIEWSSKDGTTCINLKDKISKNARGKIKPLCFGNTQGSCFAYSDSDGIRLYYMRTKGKPFYLNSPADSASFSNDDTLIVSSNKRKVLVWDVDYQMCLASIEMQHYKIPRNAFSANDTKFIILNQEQPKVVNCEWLKKYVEFVKKGSCDGHTALLLYYINHAHQCYERGVMPSAVAPRQLLKICKNLRKNEWAIFDILNVAHLNFALQDPV